MVTHWMPLPAAPQQ
ncbi:TPA: DUF551 domain-containing protein [Salmonella enterica subsp. enterica]